MVEGGEAAYSERAFDEEMMTAIDGLAREFGETGEQWLEEYGGISRERVARAARQLMHPERSRSGVGGGP